jgi:hypothetical protein
LLWVGWSIEIVIKDGGMSESLFEHPLVAHTSSECSYTPGVQPERATAEQTRDRLGRFDPTTHAAPVASKEAPALTRYLSLQAVCRCVRLFRLTNFHRLSSLDRRAFRVCSSRGNDAERKHPRVRDRITWSVMP